MLRVKKLALIFSVLATAVPAFASDSGVAAAAEALFHLGPLPVTNSMVTSWVVALVLIIAIRIAIKRPKLIPTRGQAMVESLVQGIYDLISPIVGSKVAKPAFPLLVGLFTFILIQNWSGLVPGVGTIYMVDHETGGWMELIRPGNADLNGTLALAIVAIAGWFYFIMRYAGPSLVLKDIFGNKADKSEVPAIIYYPLFHHLFPGRPHRNHLDRLPPDFPLAATFRQRVRRREPHACDERHAKVGPADALLLSRAADRLCAGVRLHAARQRLHRPDLQPRRRPRSRPRRRTRKPRTDLTFPAGTVR